MSKIIRNCILLLFVASVMSCARNIVDLTGSIMGVVKDYYDGHLISDCRVSLSPGGQSVLTGNDGAFEFKNLDAGSYTLSFVKSGYDDLSHDLSVSSQHSTDVQVAMKAQKAELSVSSNLLDFGGSISTLSFEIANRGNGALEWSLSENATWLTCSPSNGTLTAAGSTVVTVSVNRTDVTNGNYSENIVVASNGGDATITALMSVSALAGVTISPLKLDFASIETSIEVKLMNVSGKPLKYQVEVSNSWLSLSKMDGILSGDDQLYVIASRAGLSPGDYSGSLVVTIEGETVSIPVTMRVQAKEKPEVSMESVYSVTHNSAIAKASIKSVGSSRVHRYGFCWSEQPDPTVNDFLLNYGDCSIPRSFEGSLQSLKCGTKFYVRAYAENDEGLSYSSQIQTFTTAQQPTLPTVKTLPLEMLSTTSAVAQGEVVSMGNVPSLVAYGHVWGTNSQPTLETSFHNDLGQLQSPRLYQSELSQLTANTTYYVRSYATNSEGTSYGDVLEFTTKDYVSPVVEISVPDEVESNYITVTGTILSTGGLPLSRFGHCLSTSPSPSLDNCQMYSEGDDPQLTVFRSSFTGLTPKTTYYLCSYAENAKGVGYSAPVTVTTPEITGVKWDGDIASAFAGGSGEPRDPYIIQTGGQLILMKSYPDKCFELGGNIDLDNKNWLPFSFSGTLDGKGYTILNLNIKREDNGLGLFSQCTGSVSNLTIQGIQIIAPTKNNIGAFAGVGSGKFDNCHLVMAPGSKMLGNQDVGGIVGCNDEKKTEFVNCTVTMSSGSYIDADNRAGGLIGEVQEAVSDAVEFKVDGCSVLMERGAYIASAGYSGGLVGSIYEDLDPYYRDLHRTMVTNSLVKGTLKGKVVGGLIGRMSFSSSEISSCGFEGVIYGLGDNIIIGGLVGQLCNNNPRSDGNSKITACKASVEISATSGQVGGLVGQSESIGGTGYKSKLVACYSTGRIQSSGTCQVDAIAPESKSLGSYLSYSTVESNTAIKASTTQDCCSTSDVVPSGSNCKGFCSDITTFMRECYSEYAKYWNFNKTWLWDGDINGSHVKVSCPRLYWE